MGSRTPEPPRTTGWYVVWRPSGETYTEPETHFCTQIEGDHDIGCMDACGGHAFRSVKEPYFTGALWHGPFSSRREALDATRAA